MVAASLIRATFVPPRYILSPHLGSLRVHAYIRSSKTGRNNMPVVRQLLIRHRIQHDQTRQERLLILLLSGEN